MAYYMTSLSLDKHQWFTLICKSGLKWNKKHKTSAVLCKYSNNPWLADIDCTYKFAKKIKTHSDLADLFKTALFKSYYPKC